MADLDLDATGADASPSAGEPAKRSGRARGERAERRAFWAELPFLVVVALVLAIVLKTFVVQAFYIPSSSMEPTLMVQDRVLVTKLAYLYREPERGEIVVFREPADQTLGQPEEGLASRLLGSLASGLGFGESGDIDFIKRIIGLPGDTLEMTGGVVFINGDALPEAAVTDGGYLSRADLSDFGPVTVEEGHYFMMGDNRPNSSDSRFGLGQIPRENIVGRAFVTIWPVSSFGSLPIAEYGE